MEWEKNGIVEDVTKLGVPYVRKAEGTYLIERGCLNY